MQKTEFMITDLSSHKGSKFVVTRDLIYFKKTYGSNFLTVIHRMRTWYRQQYKKLLAQGDHVAAARVFALEYTMSALIAEAKGN
jgi:hypothetical protein